MLKRITVTALVVLLVFAGAVAVYIVRQRHSDAVAFMNEVRYELGPHQGAQYCGACHEDIYQQWQTSSRHATANTAASVLEVMHKLKHHTILNFILRGKDMCYACHGPAAASEGVDCETCHGVVLPKAAIMETHEQKYKPGLAVMRSEDFCAKCHEIPGFVTPYSDWQRSAAAARGTTCQACHMAATEDGHAYHGFDSFVRDQHLYDGDVTLADIRFEFPTLSLVVENHIQAHSIPAGGPTRILALEMSVRDARGIEVKNNVATFAKYHSLIPVLGFWPAKIIADTQLKSGEKRQVSFTLPPELAGTAASIQLVLRFYEVADEDEGRLDKAYFVSEPILRQVIPL